SANWRFPATTTSAISTKRWRFMMPDGRDDDESLSSIVKAWAKGANIPETVAQAYLRQCDPEPEIKLLIRYCQPCDRCVVLSVALCPDCGSSQGYVCTDYRDVPLTPDSLQGRQFCEEHDLDIPMI